MTLPAESNMHQEPSARQLKRSNALRIKSNNLELLPLALRESLLALRRQISEAVARGGGPYADCQEEEPEEELTLLEQIKRGVKLKPVDRRKESISSKHEMITEGPQEESISSILVRVLRQRYLAMQQAEGETDDDDDDYQSDSSSIMDLYLVSEPASGGQISCVLYGSGATLANSAASCRRRTLLLEKLGEYSTIKMRATSGGGGAAALDLTNDLVIRL